MSIEDNVDLARRFYDGFTNNDIDTVMATLAEDARFRVPGKPDEFHPAAGTTKPNCASCSNSC